MSTVVKRASISWLAILISSIITGAHAHSNKEKESDANQLASDGCLNSESMMRFFCLGLRNVLDATTAK
ncbi:uncharacterized protein isoform X2 [Musca autumnalis]|uniref:uncharacterized protein isoform X2 n=1 Tax=Musca autumnalis TaxID=221902 RepID=UPI003CF2D0C6